MVRSHQSFTDTVVAAELQDPIHRGRARGEVCRVGDEDHGSIGRTLILCQDFIGSQTEGGRCLILVGSRWQRVRSPMGISCIRRCSWTNLDPRDDVCALKLIPVGGSGGSNVPALSIPITRQVTRLAGPKSPMLDIRPNPNKTPGTLHCFTPPPIFSMTRGCCPPDSRSRCGVGDGQHGFVPLLFLSRRLQ
jgi:hypothetical protein